MSAWGHDRGQKCWKVETEGEPWPQKVSSQLLVFCFNWVTLSPNRARTQVEHDSLSVDHGYLKQDLQPRDKRKPSNKRGASQHLAVSTRKLRLFTLRQGQKLPSHSNHLKRGRRTDKCHCCNRRAGGGEGGLGEQRGGSGATRDSTSLRKQQLEGAASGDSPSFRICAGALCGGGQVGWAQ